MSYNHHQIVERWLRRFRGCLNFCYGSDSQMITMELHKGGVQLLSVPQNKNIFNTRKYRLYNFLPKTLYSALERFGNIYLLGISLIMLIDPTLTPFYRWITIFPVGLSVIFYILMEFILDIRRQSHDHKINMQTTSRGAKDGSLEYIKWSDIQIGDVLYLIKGDIVPADIILLDTGQVRDREAICMVDTQYYDGKSTLTKKKSSYLTQLIVLRTRLKNQFPEYRKMLTGKLEYEAPNGNTEKFHGRLKLKKDPKNEELTIDNFIPKGTKIKQTSWLFGLVVYVGENTKTMQSSHYNAQKHSFEEKQCNFYSFLMACLSLFFTLISIIVLLARSDEGNFALLIDTNTTNGMKVFQLAILYAQLIPSTLYLLLDFVNFISLFKFEINQIEDNITKYVKINSSNNLSDLGHVDYMLIDKTGTLTTSYYKLDNLLFGSLSFTLNYDQLQSTLNLKSAKPEDNEDPVKFASINDNNEYLIPFEYERKSSPSDVQPSGKLLLKSVKTSNNNPVFSQITALPQNKRMTMLNMMENSLQQPLADYLQTRIFLPQPKTRNSPGNNNDEFIQLVNQLKASSPQKEYLSTDDINTLYYDAFLKCLMLCHEARPVFGADSITYESFSKNEEISLTFARSCGYSLENFNKFDSPDMYLCKVRGNPIWYQILGLNLFTYTRNLNSVVIQAPVTMDLELKQKCEAINQLCGEGSKNNSLLICKGDYEAIKTKLQLNHKEREELDSYIQHYKQRGIRMIIYATRVLSERETENYKQKFNLLHSSLTNQDILLEQLALEYEKELNIMGMIGFKEELKNDALDFIKTVKDCNINIWLLSGDQEVQTISCAQSLEMTETSKYLRIVATEKEQIWLQINTAIGQIQSELQKIQEKQQDKHQDENLMVRSMIKSSVTLFEGASYQQVLQFVLIVNGHSLSLISESADLMSHFRFLSCVCKNVIGFNMNPQQKELACLIIRNYFPNNPTVLGVGDGYNDALMMQAANVSIEIINSKRNHIYPQVNAGDISVNTLSEIKVLLLQKCKLHSERVSAMIIYLFYCAGFLGMTLFFFNWFCQFTATSLHDSMTVFLYIFLYTTPNALVIGLADKQSQPAVNARFPAFYIDGQIRTRRFWFFYLIEGFLESFISAAYTFYACTYMVNYAWTNDGHQSDIQMVATSIIYLLITVSSLKVLFRLFYNKVNIVIIVFLFTFGLLVGFVFINYRRDFSNFDYQELTYQLFTRFNSIVAMVFSLIGCYFINYFLHNFIKLIYFPNAYQQFAFQNTTGTEWEIIRNQEILHQCLDQHVNVSSIIQNLFIDCSATSPYIQEMLNPGDTKVTEMKLKPLTLEMKELVLEQKFLAHKLMQSLKHLRLFLCILLIYYIAYCLTDFFMTDKRVFTGAYYLVVFGIIFFIILFSCSQAMELQYYTYSHLIVLIIFAIKVAIDWLSDDLTITLSATIVILFSTFNSMNMSVIPIMLYNVCYLIQLIVRILIVVISTDLSTSNGTYSQSRVSVYAASTQILLVVSITIRFLFSYYKSIKHRRNDYLAKYQIEQDNVAAQDILRILVPGFVRQQIQTGTFSMQQAQDDVSILFAYICDFDTIMKEEGKNVVLMLDSLFRLYDNLCIQHGVQKIETVGYTYMAATGIKACEQNMTAHVTRIEKTMRLVNMAFDMMQQVQGRKYGKGNQIEMKIGIHVGRVIAGVIGHHKPQFSLIGDPVNQTSRVGSTGDTGAITLSEQAFKQARHGIKYYEKKQKEAKGLGIIDTYQVFKTKPAGYQIPKAFQLWQNCTKLVVKELRQHRTSGTKKQGQFLSQLQNSIYQDNLQKSNRLDASPRGQQTVQILLPQGGSAQEEIRSRLTIPAQITEQILTDDSILITNEQEEKELELIKPNLILDIPENEIKSNFYQILKEQNVDESRIGMIFLWITYFVITLLSIIVRKLFKHDLLIFVLRAIFLILSFVLFPILSKAYRNRTVNTTYYLLLIYAIFTVLFQAYLTDNREVAIICLLEILYIMIVSCQMKMFSFLQVILYMMIMFGLFLGFYISTDLITHYAIFYICCCMLILLLGYYLAMSEQIQMFNNLQINEEKKVKRINLVSQLLPMHSYLKMKNSSIYDKSDFIDEFDDVTLLFADIKGFTEYSHTQSPEGVVLMLRNLFTEFDKLCQRYNVYKMYTIGDCYVVMGFTNSAKRNPIQEAINTVKMGFQMVDIIMSVRQKIQFDKLNMRIGIHTGQVTGGIIGTDIVRYDIYGKDVSIANKMESSGVEGRVQISETTKLMIERAGKHAFNFKFHHDVELNKFNMNIKGFLVDWDKKREEASLDQYRSPSRHL
ncbi:unnamed protein product [Paramecium octaurelia]|uniref:guanylate cyclase n=1 Tax=Paramecium octaurelia TaxID=43137 RepID=A0A8S1XGU7_PAROT|nr:unnamed protein product [Paramecium octaurelia]